MNSKAIRKQLLAAVAMVLVAAVALGSSTYAWFVNNNKVTANLNNVSATAASASLYIKYGKQTAVPTDNLTTDSGSSSLSLVPVSNNYNNGSLGDWFIVNGWENAEANGYAPLTGTNKVSAYDYQEMKSGEGDNATLTGATIRVSADNSKRVGVYTVGEYTLYTATGNQDIYLDPTNPITVTEGTLTGKTANLKSAIRIAIVATSDSKTTTLYYLPVAETKAGNDKGSGTTGAANSKVYGVSSTTTITEIAAGTQNSSTGYFVPDAVADDSTTVKSIGYWTASSVGNGSYNKGTHKLGTAGNTTDTMMDVKVYVWLEGTDGECLIDQGVDGVTGLNVSVNFVGVEPTTT